VTWATSVPILIFLGLSVLVLGPMYATDRRQREASLTVPAYRGRGIIMFGINLSVNIFNARLIITPGSDSYILQ